LNILALQHN